MYAVIFRATIASLDDEYLKTAAQLKELALDNYGCLEFVSVTEGNEEIAISYWDNEEQIHAWKKDPEHRRAQQKGRTKWYKSFRVEICKLSRAHGNTQGK